MRILIRLPLFAAILILAAGCQYHRQVSEEAREAAAAAAASYEPFLARQSRATRAAQVRVDRHAPWLLRKSTAVYQNLPATQAVRAVLAQQPVFFAPAIKDDPPVRSPAAGGTVQEHLDSIAAQANWAYRVEEGGDVVWTSLPTRVFPLAIPQGTRTARLGRSGSNSSGASSGDEGSGDSQRDDSQQAELSHFTSPYDEMEASLRTVLSEEYTFSLLPSANSVVVTAPPDVMRRVEILIARFNRAATQRVLVELEIYLVDLSDSEQETLDWTFLRNAGSGLQFKIEAKPDGILGLEPPFRLSLSDLSDGRYSGSQLIFNALAEQGVASVVARPRLIGLNNQVSELRVNRVTPYTENVRFRELDRGATTETSPEIETARVVGGTTIYVLPSIEGDRVSLILSANYTRINRFITQTLGEGVSRISIQLPEYDDTQFTLPIALRSGETMVLAGNPSTVSNSRALHRKLVPLWRGSRSSQRRTETVMLITAHILDSA